MRQCRESLGMSVRDINGKTGIKPQFIECLEQGDLIKLPPDVYVMGFLKKLAVLYNVEPECLTDQYRRERGIAVMLKRQRRQAAGWKKNIFGSLVITPGVLSLLGGLLFTFVTSGYIVYQIYSINRVPSLVIYEPQDNRVIRDTFVNINGRTDPGMLVTINGQEIFVDSDGNFKTQLGITPGPRDLTVVAINKFGKQASQVVSVIGESSKKNNEDKGISLKFDFSSDVSLAYSIDSKPEQSMDFHAGDSKLLSGDAKIVISASDGGAVIVALNGQPLGVLGRPHEVLKNIPFFAENSNAR